jgi:hypothetical protein
MDVICCKQGFVTATARVQPELIGVAADVHVVLARSVTSILAALAVERVGPDEWGRTAECRA